MTDTITDQPTYPLPAPPAWQPVATEDDGQIRYGLSFGEDVHLNRVDYIDFTAREVVAGPVEVYLCDTIGDVHLTLEQAAELAQRLLAAVEAARS